MSYFILENDELNLKEVEELPQEIEELYNNIRAKYVIEYDVSNWADDDRDAGMGYCYDNSYSAFREVERRELVFENGNLVGFYVGYCDNVKMEVKPTKKYFLKLENNALIFENGTYSRFYGDSKSWKLKIENDSKPFEYVYLRYVKNENPKYEFKPKDFNEELIESVVKITKIENSRGGFGGAFRVKLKLTNKGISNPDLVLKELRKFIPYIVKE